MASTDLALADAGAPVLTVTGRHWSALAPYETQSGALEMGSGAGIPKADAERCVVELKSALRPAGPQVGMKLARLLSGAYDRKEMTDPQVYAAFMAEVFAWAPGDIGMQAVKEVVRTCKWLPKPADVAPVVDRLTRKRAMMLEAAEKALQAHQTPRDEPQGKRWADMTIAERTAMQMRLDAAMGRDGRAGEAG